MIRVTPLPMMRMRPTVPLDQAHPMCLKCNMQDKEDLPDLVSTGHSSSDDSNDESDNPMGRPSFYNEAKSHTYINFPPRKCGVKTVRKQDVQRLKKLLWTEHD
jgi:hypothetical protein